MAAKKAKKSFLKSLIKFIFVLVLIPVALFLLLVLKLQFTEEKAVFATDQAKGISYTPLTSLVPGGDLPKEVSLYRSNNNLDIIKFKDRCYFSFRSAPSHFASTKTMLYVLSSPDCKKWEFETKYNFGSDLREPRFMIFKDRLFLYFFQGGANPLSFAPDHIYATEFMSKGKWAKPKSIYEKGYVIWRAKEHAGRAYMSVYFGAGLYSNENEPGHLRLLVSDDGYNYKLVDNMEAQTRLSSEEGEFEFDDDGTLYSTVRYEMLGGGVCSAPANALSKWDCKHTDYKYDSALMFRHGADFYVIARRNVAGKYHQSSKLIPDSIRKKWNLVRYSGTRKRTALYKLDKEKKELLPLFDFPSRGDTAYAGIIQMSPHKYLVYNYSSDIDKFDWSWIGGQLAGSKIYATELEFKSE